MSTRVRRIGLFFGSFNPVHIGHMAIANYFLQYSDLEEVWFVLSPQNPHKKKTGMLDPWLRLNMLHLAVGTYPGFRVSDIELYLPQPSYTSITLAHLTERNPGVSFALIMGSDTVLTLPKWFNYQYIIHNYPLYVYPRPGSEEADLLESIIVKVSAPQMEISASFIREGIKEGKDLRFFVPEAVYQYLMREQLYR